MPPGLLPPPPPLLPQFSAKILMWVRQECLLLPLPESPFSLPGPPYLSTCYLFLGSPLCCLLQESPYHRLATGHCRLRSPLSYHSVWNPISHPRGSFTWAVPVAHLAVLRCPVPGCPVSETETGPQTSGQQLLALCISEIPHRTALK